MRPWAERPDEGDVADRIHTIPPIQLRARPCAFCPTCDGLGLVSNPVCAYPVPCDQCGGSGCTERAGGVVWVDAPPADWLALTIVAACALVVVTIVVVCVVLQ